MVVAPTIDKCINPCAAVVVEEEKQNERSENVSVCKRVERKRAAMAAALLPLQQLQVQQLRAGS
jgi:hypothetical protein